jgi:flagellin
LIEIDFSAQGMDAKSLSVDALKVDTQADATKAIDSIDAALKLVDAERSTYGATINRLNYAADNLANISQNTAASRSRILDTDYAATTTELARTQIISQAATAMLAQANQAPQTVMSLLR